MKKYSLVVQSNPVAGLEKEYNDWYNNIHIPGILKIPGFTGAQRFTLDDEKASTWKYMAIYEFETEDLAATIGALQAQTMEDAKAAGSMPVMDQQSFSFVFWTPVTEKFTPAR
jgi:hypothetical protein